jgi:uncharacterized protein
MFFPLTDHEDAGKKQHVGLAGISLLASVAVCGVLIGVAIGAVGIGGVLLVPILTLALGIPVKNAIAAALMSYLPSGSVAVVLYARRKSIPWREARWICVSAAPMAYLGALSASHAPAALLEALIGTLLLAGGFHALRSRPAASEFRRLSPLALSGLGGVTAFVSALTGAGGAFVLLPMLLLLDAPVLGAIGLGQAIQVPIAGVASATNLAAGLVDAKLALILAASLAIGIAIGTPIAHALPQQGLRGLLGGITIVAGTAMLLRTATELARLF